jgi:hypothetical protein
MKRGKWNFLQETKKQKRKEGKCKGKIEEKRR